MGRLGLFFCVRTVREIGEPVAMGGDEVVTFFDEVLEDVGWC